MLKDTGVYTAKCPTCSRSILIHLLSDGSISPNKCAHCHAEFEGLNNGKQRNTFVVVLKTKKPTIVVNQKAEETKKTDEKSFRAFPLTKKANKKSFTW